MKRILCTLCCSLLGWQALAGNVDDSLKKLEAALKKSDKEAAAKPAEPGMPSRGDISMMVLPRLRDCIASNNINGAVEMLQQFNASPMLSEDAQKAAAELLTTLRKDQEARDKAFAAQIDEALKHATDAVKTAKTPADLDTVLQELANAKRWQETRRYVNPEMQSNRNQIEATYRFVARWQDYLSALAGGNAETCRNILRDLANSETLLIPRSELLAKAQEPISSKAEPATVARPPEEIADELIGKTKSLEEVGDLIKQLRILSNQQRHNGWESGALTTRIQGLERIDKSYREFQAGLATNIDPSADSSTASMAPLRRQLMLLVLPRYISAPTAKAKPGEDVVEFLNRVAEEAKARGDIALVTRSREALRQIQHSTSWTSNDSQALSSFQAAQNQEVAGQYQLAIVSYQTALKGGSDAIPAKFIGERLAEIKKNHPEDYDKGMERFLTPPPVQLAPMNPAMMMNRYPGWPGQPQPTPTPTPEAPKLTIPPASVPSATAVTPAAPQPSRAK